MSNLNTYALYDIVKKINGGGIEPVGETNYDNKAFWRQKEIEKLADMLIDDLLRVFEIKGWERSIEDARNDAKKWFENLKDTVDEILDVKLEETTTDDAIAEYNAWKITISENVSPDCAAACDMAFEALKKLDKIRQAMYISGCDYETRCEEVWKIFENQETDHE